MTSKNDLQEKMKSFGYDLNPFTSKDTLVNLMRLHTKVLEQGIDVASMNDHQLRLELTKHNIAVGPVINYTRAIYQRKLLEAIANENSEGLDDEPDENQEDEFITPPIEDTGVVTRSRRSFFPAKD